MKQIFFCTLFSENYTLQGLTLLKSLINAGVKPSELWVLCLDGSSFEAVKKIMPFDINVIRLQDCQPLNSKFREFTKKRSFSESIFSIKPLFIKTIMNELNEEDWLTYIDADSLAFPNFSSRALIPEKQSILLSPHYYADFGFWDSATGLFNAGFVGFKKNQVGQEAIDFWTRECEKLCSISKATGLYADQKYLDSILERWPTEVAFTPKGVNFSTWSLKQESKIYLANGLAVNVDDCEIKLFHYHGFRHSRFITVQGAKRYGAINNFKLLQNLIYNPYVHQIALVRNEISIMGEEGFLFERKLRPFSVTWRGLLFEIRKNDIRVNKQEIFQFLKGRL